MTRRFSSVLIANRGEIVARVARTARAKGLRTGAIYSDADRGAPFTRCCDIAIPIGGETPGESYLSIDNIINAARVAGADAVHPGYGFLSENAKFAQAVIANSLVWIGPSPSAIAAMGDKAGARRLAAENNVPVLPGYDEADQSRAKLMAAAKKIGAPLMIKAAAGGGGRGIRRVDAVAEFEALLQRSISEAQNAFGDGRVILERALLKPRHVEVQILADAHGNVVHLGDRDCSAQRRRQKIIEEAPAPGLDPALRAAMHDASVRLARAIDYVGVGTMEFLVEDGQFYFMEMNTRLQVEHPVTEMITGLDLVALQLDIAQGEVLPFSQVDIRFSGHSIEARLCAESPYDEFQPRTGQVLAWQASATARTDHALQDGFVVSPHYDSMLAKVIAHGIDRDDARFRLTAALDDTMCLGVQTNRLFLRQLLSDTVFCAPERLSTNAVVEAPPQKRAPAFAKTVMCAVAAQSRMDPSFGEFAAWSNVASQKAPLRLKLDDDIIDGHVSLASNGVHVETEDERKFVTWLSPLCDGRGAAMIDADTSIAFAYAVDGDDVWVSGADFDLHARNVTFAPKKSAHSTGSGDVRATMNGRVVAIAAAPGDTVDAGDGVVVIEAMKMEHVLRAGVTGILKALHVGVGDQVAPGQVLAAIEPEQGARDGG
jgi:geranyl-CoA carboxylase alpha subunit